MKISSYVMALLGSAGRRCGSCWWRVGWSSVYGAAVQADWLTELLWVWAEKLKLLTLTVGFPLHSGDRWARPWSVNYRPSCWRPSTASLCASPSAALPLIPTSPPLKKKKKKRLLCLAFWTNFCEPPSLCFSMWFPVCLHLHSYKKEHIKNWVNSGVYIRIANRRAAMSHWRLKSN